MTISNREDTSIAPQCSHSGPASAQLQTITTPLDRCRATGARSDNGRSLPRLPGPMPGPCPQSRLIASSPGSVRTRPRGRGSPCPTAKDRKLVERTRFSHA
eukprot:2246773-Heterocapsa_arctica.AAC.1